jgi:hypothetical protein
MTIKKVFGTIIDAGGLVDFTGVSPGVLDLAILWVDGSHSGQFYPRWEGVSVNAKMKAGQSLEMEFRGVTLTSAQSYFWRVDYAFD